MLTALILLQLTIVLALIFIGARVGGFGLGILVGGRGIELKSTEQTGTLHSVSSAWIISANCPAWALFTGMPTVRRCRCGLLPMLDSMVLYGAAWVMATSIKMCSTWR